MMMMMMMIAAKDDGQMRDQESHLQGNRNESLNNVFDLSNRRRMRNEV